MRQNQSQMQQSELDPSPSDKSDVLYIGKKQKIDEFFFRQGRSLFVFNEADDHSFHPGMSFSLLNRWLGHCFSRRRKE
jgi:hypothetical protein